MVLTRVARRPTLIRRRACVVWSMTREQRAQAAAATPRGVAGVRVVSVARADGCCAGFGGNGAGGLSSAR